MMRSFFLFSLFLSAIITTAQEAPSLEFTLYDENVMHRQNVCDRQAAFLNETLPLDKALRGLEVNVLLRHNNSFFEMLNEGDQLFIDELNPGYFVELLDEIAKRGDFTWRGSFGVITGPGARNSWTELLLWGTDKFDVFCDWWIHTSSRLRQGIAFPKGFYDASLILLTIKQPQEDEDTNLYVDFFGRWLEPFETTVWVVIVVTIVITSILLRLIEHKNVMMRPEEPHFFPSYFGPLYASFMIFMQHVQITPVTIAGKILCASLAFWSLIIISSYTANLASFYVIQKTRAPSEIKSLGQAVDKGKGICVWAGNALEDFVNTHYPTGNFIFISASTELEYYEALASGKCSFAIATAASWEQTEGDASLSVGCSAEKIGPTIQSSEAGLALKADTDLCTSFLKDVFNLHMTEMMIDGTIDRLWSQNLGNTTCVVETEIASSTSQLTFLQMSGTFFLHYIFTIAAVFITFVPLVFRKTRTTIPRYIKIDRSKRHGKTNADAIYLEEVPEQRPSVMNTILNRRNRENGSTGRYSQVYNITDEDALSLLIHFQEMLNAQASKTQTLSQNNSALMQDMQTMLTQLRSLNQNDQLDEDEAFNDEGTIIWSC